MDKYRPTLQSRKQTVLEQISEYQRVYYRTEIERREHEASGEGRQVEADDFNNKNMEKKLDLLFEILKELEDEQSKTGSSSSV